MKRMMLGLIILMLTCVFSGCGGQNDSKNSQTTISLSQDSSANATPPNTKSLGKVEVIGEKTKTVDTFEITLESGEVQSTLNQMNGKKSKPLHSEIMVMKAKIKSIKNYPGSDNELHYFMVYEANESQMGENYIGSHVGIFGEDLAGNLKMQRYEENKEYEGYIYLDVEKRDAYRILYEDTSGERGYWDVKITN